MRDNERAWLEGLQPGDRVIVTNGRDEHASRVTRRTPSGRILVKSLYGADQVFNADGNERGKDSYYRSWLARPTPATVARIEGRILSKRLRAVQWEDIPLDTKRQVWALLTPAPAQAAGDATEEER